MCSLHYQLLIAFNSALSWRDAVRHFVLCNCNCNCDCCGEYCSVVYLQCGNATAVTARGGIIALSLISAVWECSTEV